MSNTEGGGTRPNPETTRRNVLRVICKQGMVRGRDIKRFAQVQSDELKAALDSLTKDKIVTVQTGSLGLESTEAALDAYVALLPSAKAAAEQELSR